MSRTRRSATWSTPSIMLKASASNKARLPGILQQLDELLCVLRLDAETPSDFLQPFSVANEFSLERSSFDPTDPHKVRGILTRE